ncbi:MAG: ethanolamine ammonia-lyase subunit EutC [Chloroflexota bacterium]
MSEANQDDQKHVVKNSWHHLRRFTDARIGLGRVGNSIPTKELLAFQMDHANAKDAVHIPLDAAKLAAELPDKRDQLHLKSQAANRAIYLQRPDLGRRLSPESAKLAGDHLAEHSQSFSVVIVIVDGLSSTAVQAHAGQMATMLCQRFEQQQESIAPICIVEQGRVAIGDEIGDILQAECLVLMVGERPGLSSPDSLGIYYTYKPKVGLQDSNRNCISNIRPGGLSFEEACDKLLWLIQESRNIQQSGVMLKDESENQTSTISYSQENNLLLADGDEVD